MFAMTNSHVLPLQLPYTFLVAGILIEDLMTNLETKTLNLFGKTIELLHLTFQDSCFVSLSLQQSSLIKFSERPVKLLENNFAS